METHNLFQANLDNLTAMWHALGAETTTLSEGSHQHQSLGWPHRLWFDVQESASAADRAEMIATATSSSREFLLPAWRAVMPTDAHEQWHTELERSNLQSALRTTVMDADLDTIDWQGLTTPALQYEDGNDQIEAWSELASRSFGYHVDSRMVARLRDRSDSRLILARLHGTLVGTGLLFTTGNVAGLHMLGVAPEARRQGIAGAVMLRLLEAARADGQRHAALQASALGEGLYRKLGFAPSGHINWFRRGSNGEVAV
tara:strand:+ start:288 stop:1061 length:774 start_codon:yes stop_codon:yes gene_type:complete